MKSAFRLLIALWAGLQLTLSPLLAATVTGTVTDVTGTGISAAKVIFKPLSNPQLPGGGVIIVSASKTITADSSGAFSVDLEAGDYTVLIQGRDSFSIAVPTGSASYPIENLTTSDLTYVYAATPSTYPTATATQVGAVKTDTTASPPVVYLTESVDTLLAQRAGAVDNLAALLALPAAHGDTVLLRGLTTAGDGGGGVVRWSSGSNFVADGGYVYQATGGQWMRDTNQPANPRWFGAKGDWNNATTNGTDDTAAFVAMINSPYGLGNTNNEAYGALQKVWVPAGSYKIQTPLLLYSTNQSANVGNYARGSVNWEGAGRGATIFFFDGTNNAMVTGNGRVNLRSFTIDSTAARLASASSITETNGNGLVLGDPVDGLGVNWNGDDLSIQNQPSFAIRITGAPEQITVRQTLISRNVRGGIRANTDTNFIGASTFGGYMVLWDTVRSIDNGGPGWAMDSPLQHTWINCESINNCNPLYSLNPTFKTGWIEMALTNAVGCIFLNLDVEDNRITSAVKLPAYTNLVFSTNSIHAPSANFATNGFTTNMLLVVSGTRAQQGFTSLDGAYLITSVGTTNLGLESLVSPLANVAFTNAVTLEGSGANIGMYFSSGRVNTVQGGFAGSISAGIVVNGLRDSLFKMARTINYSAPKAQGIVGLWDVASSAASYGNTFHVPSGVDAPLTGFYGKYAQSSNIVIRGSQVDSLQIGTTNRGTVLSLTGGNSGVPIVEITRDGFEPMTLSISGSQQLVIGNGSVPRFKAMFGGDNSQNLWRVGTTGSTNPLPSLIYGDKGSGTDIAGGTLTLASGEGTGAAAVPAVVFRVPLLGSSGSTTQTLQTILQLQSHTTNNQTAMFAYWYTGSNWTGGWIMLGAAGTGPGGSGRMLYIP